MAALPRVALSQDSRVVSPTPPAPCAGVLAHWPSTGQCCRRHREHCNKPETASMNAERTPDATVPLRIDGYQVLAYSFGDGPEVLFCLSGGPGAPRDYLRDNHQPFAHPRS